MKRNFKKIFLILIILGLLLLPKTSQAILVDAVVDFFTSLIIKGVAGLLDLAYGILNWVISPSFLGVSMTGPDNPIVTSGWGTIRNLAYLFLILATIAIIFGIILRIREYEAKKVLPVLIIIALLINFTPVICGIIIDFSNILMKYFLSGGMAGGFAEAVEKGLEEAKDAAEPAQQIVNALVFIIFGIIGAIVFLLYAFLFAIRYVALWILIIFSPIAFVSRIFPPSPHIKKFFPSIFHWDEWWNQFIQWCVIGIFGAFFVYLANRLMIDWITELSPSESGSTIIGDVYLYLFPIVLLLIGFFTTLETAQGVASLITSNVAKAVGTAGKGWAALKPLRERIRTGATQSRRSMEEIWSTYQTQRAVPGVTRREALRHTLGAYWQRIRPSEEEITIRGRRVIPAGRKAQIVRGAISTGVAIGAIAKGTFTAARDTAKIGIREALGIPKKKKERPTCSKCGNFVPAGAAHCPHCGAPMPVCPHCGLRPVAGAKFCNHCGTRI